MKTSFAQTAEPEFLEVAKGASNNENSSVGASAPPVKEDLGDLKPIYAMASRKAGRLNAANVSDEELADLLKERETLLDKKLVGSILRKEENRLEYVRWSLDRIEDARHGEALDSLADWTQKYEAFIKGLDDLQTRLTESTKHRGR